MYSEIAFSWRRHINLIHCLTMPSSADRFALISLMSLNFAVHLSFASHSSSPAGSLMRALVDAFTDSGVDAENDLPDGFDFGLLRMVQVAHEVIHADRFPAGH